MALPVIISRNSVQTIDGSSATIARVTAAATGVYTVPAGKVSKILGATMVLDAVGADATYALAVLRAGSYRAIGAYVPAGGASILSNIIILAAGDILTNIGDNGSTNGTVDMSLSFKEFNV